MWSVPTKSHAAITCNLAIRTLAEIKEMPTQSVSFSHSPRSGIANAPTAPGPKPQRPHHPKRKGLNRATVDHRQSEFIVHEAAIVSGIGLCLFLDSRSIASRKAKDSEGGRSP